MAPGKGGVREYTPQSSSGDLGGRSSTAGEGFNAGYATPPLPSKFKRQMMPKSTSFTIQSLSTWGDEDAGEQGRASVGGGGRSRSLEDNTGTGAAASLYVPGSTGGGLSKSNSLNTIHQASASTSWATKVDPARLPSIPADERKRQEAIFELIATEQSYVRDLESICHTFYGPMSGMLSPPDLAAIFANIEDIKLVNAVILSDFEAIQTEQDFIIDGIGEIFVRHAGSLTVYQSYCGNFAHALKVLQKCRTDNPRLQEFLKREQTNNPLCRSLDLSSFLLQPMQRITRYSLLLKQVLHYTPKAHPDHEAVVRALAMSEREAEMVNSAARERESKEKLEEVGRVLDLSCNEEHKLDLTAPTRVFGPRIFIHEGDLTKSKSGRKLHAYLFNDVLLLAQPKGKQERNVKGYTYGLYKKPMPLNEIAVRDPHKVGKEVAPVDEACFQIVHGQDAVTVRAPSAAAKRKWVNTLEEQTRQYFVAEKSLAEGAWKGGRFVEGRPIGTLSVNVLEGKELAVGGAASKGNKLEIYARVQLNRQQVKTRTVNSRTPHWNQTLVFSVLSLDETLKLSLFNYDRYSQDEYLGHAALSLDLLEYYGEKETEVITLPLQDVRGGSISVKLAFRRS
ncbi:rho guanine nucleotide exchange factor [Fimicolochytrium jonesii]|uniref:rho guanine nucleotide exchange factor n=1 Tax=Fimicolochytrium jonesii TaxID=1396493 RepID=UPI0022FDD086|nr:rho guanine nucleotide exchange factor [Fimicolochytrium jonesii]KAI8820089.1 Dbl homology domain-containing protein [Fimicolochytrium jonesii]